ncbi:hypothetical protein QDA02_gp72 [Microbacterium phage Margaery]|uniref:Uncharacterized protein n=1 Tax=Microbacterium phage Margaery TaxID=2591217 RepID=A0A514DHL0_9CAUD|nr:hypothetical protein QDA02_gp72 [Microbacterium phage Margaery]QDH93093.1 hypothetical protein PBI_MARGAERY_36 [Microbacterium phage Margaery]
MRARIEVPPIEVIVPDADPVDPSDEHDIAYNAWITDRVREHLATDPEVEVVYANGQRDILGLSADGDPVAVSA